MSGFFPSPVQVEQRTFLETQHKGNNISRESNKKWETEDLAISHGRKLPGCVGVTYNHDTILNAMLPKLQLQACWIKRKYWSQSTNLPSTVRHLAEIKDIKSTEKQAFV